MVINVHFLADDGKKNIAQLPDSFTYRDFVNMVDKLYGPNSHTVFTFVAKGKPLCTEDEGKFNQQKKLITNSVNIYAGRRMHGGLKCISFCEDEIFRFCI